MTTEPFDYPDPQTDEERWAVDHMRSIEHTEKGQKLLTILKASRDPLKKERAEYCLQSSTVAECWEKAVRLLGLELDS